MKIEISEATENQLDYLVAKIEGLNVYIPAYAETPWLQYRDSCGQPHPCPKYSSDWSQGGPIIERETINIGNYSFLSKEWFAKYPSDDYLPQYIRWGDAPLIAAMRCYVASKLGEEVEIPDSLIK